MIPRKKRSWDVDSSGLRCRHSIRNWVRISRTRMDTLRLDESNLIDRSQIPEVLDISITKESRYTSTKYSVVTRYPARKSSSLALSIPPPLIGNYSAAPLHLFLPESETNFTAFHYL